MPPFSLFLLCLFLFRFSSLFLWSFLRLVRCSSSLSFLLDLASLPFYCLRAQKLLSAFSFPSFPLSPSGFFSPPFSASSSSGLPETSGSMWDLRVFAPLFSFFIAPPASFLARKKFCSLKAFFVLLSFCSISSAFSFLFLFPFLLLFHSANEKGRREATTQQERRWRRREEEEGG